MPGQEGVAGLRIGRLAPDDWPLARSLRLAALAADPEGFGGSYARDAALTGQQWRDDVERDLWMVARDQDGTPAGLAVLYPHDTFPDGAPQLGSMWVAPQWRGRGVARRLVTTITAEARRLGADALGLWVTAGNEQARGVYAKLGFHLTGAMKPAPRDPAVAMHRMLRRIDP